MEVVEKLALKHKITPEMLKLVDAGLLKFGGISIPYIMRNAKCTKSMAYEIIKEWERQNPQP